MKTEEIERLCDTEANLRFDKDVEYEGEKIIQIIKKTDSYPAFTAEEVAEWRSFFGVSDWEIKVYEEETSLIFYLERGEEEL